MVPLCRNKQKPDSAEPQWAACKENTSEILVTSPASKGEPQTLTFERAPGVFQTLQMEADVRGLDFKRRSIGGFDYWKTPTVCSLFLNCFFVCIICLSKAPVSPNLQTTPNPTNHPSTHPIHLFTQDAPCIPQSIIKTIKVFGLFWGRGKRYSTVQCVAFDWGGHGDQTWSRLSSRCGSHWHSKPLPAVREYSFLERWMWEGGACVQNTGHLLFIRICTDGRFHTS